MTYRSGPEWDQRFNRKRIDPGGPNTLCPTFTIESYLEHQGESFSTKYDPNSLLYISKVSGLKVTNIIHQYLLCNIHLYVRVHVYALFIKRCLEIISILDNTYTIDLWSIDVIHYIFTILVFSTPGDGPVWHRRGLQLPPGWTVAGQVPGHGHWCTDRHTVPHLATENPGRPTTEIR